jgi:hypothetical protein
MSSSSRVDSGPQTLVVACRVDEQRCPTVPQVCCFYFATIIFAKIFVLRISTFTLLLVCRPRLRKRRITGRLLCGTTSLPLRCRLRTSLNIQSATWSPRDVHMNLPPPTLPHFHEPFWEQHPNTVPASDYDQFEPVTTQQIGTSVPSAPFANAGPPGGKVFSKTGSTHAGSSPIPITPFS